MEIIVWAGILFGFAYFLISIIYAGLSSSFAWFWFGIGVVCALILCGMNYLKKQGIIVPKGVSLIIQVLILIGAIIFIWVEGVIVYNANQAPKKNADYVIVLGAKVRGTTITKSLKARLDTAYDYLVQNPKTKVIVSGGKGTGEDISEAEAMHAYLLERGIKDNRIILEDASVNTHENIKFSRAKVKEDQASYVIVTNGFHIYRATQIAKKQGLQEISGLSAPSDSILLISYYVREAFAVMKYKLTGLI